MRLDEWRTQGKSFEQGGHRLVYWQEGEGEPLVCIHGFPTASWDWHRVWPELVRRFNVVALDMLGYGFSDKPADHAYSTFEQADFHEKLLSQLGVQRTHILAHDYGDTVAQELLARDQQRLGASKRGLRIASVCFLNGGLFQEAARIRPIQRLLKSPLGSLVARMMNEKRFARSFSSIFGKGTRPSAEELRDSWTLVSHNGGARVAHRLIRYVDERFANRSRWVGVLQTTRTPLRLVNGPDDPVSGAAMAERYRELVPNPDVVLLPGIGHYPQVEAPEAVLRALFELVARAQAGAPRYTAES